MATVRVARTLRRAAVLAALLTTTACGFPETDITATNTERTGGWHVVRTAPAESLVADVCVATPSRVDTVAERILHQVAGHGYREITLNMYGERGAIARYDWKDGVARRSAPQAGGSQTPCRTNEDRGEPAPRPEHRGA